MHKGLLDRRAPTHSRYLVFTSAGDRSNLRLWLGSSQIFDLWVTYYGDQRGLYSDIAQLYNERKGSKFQNLKYIYENWPDVLMPYDAVMVIDDDILITSAKLGALFELRERLDLWILQPAFSPRGKVSFPITRVHWPFVLRYTDFVEMTCPLFRRDKLDKFMSAYDPILAGFGTDLWFLSVLGPSLEGKVAVIDDIVCVNPHDRAKGGIREISRLQSQEVRIATWQAVKKKYGIVIDEENKREFAAVLKPPAVRWLYLLGHLATRLYLSARSVAAPGRRLAERWWKARKRTFTLPVR
jgi:hypothetical protein